LAVAAADLSAVFNVMEVVSVVTEVVKKKRNKFFAKASEAEIWTRVRRRYLTSFVGLHFEN